MITLDGRMGEGGGQVLRSALALSAITQTPLNVHHIRGGRKKGGLLNQHLTAVRALVDICGAEVDGDARGSAELTFIPGPVQAGDYAVDIGTAGSVNLVLQTVMFPLLLAADGPSSVVVMGGTHNDSSPTTDYLLGVVLPRLQQMGAKVGLKLDRHGFFPRGGGKVRLTTSPSVLSPIEVVDAPTDVVVSARALLSDIPELVGTREINTFCRVLEKPRRIGSIEHINKPRGPGNVFIAELRWDGGSEQVTAFGSRGKRAEKVAEEAAEEVRTFLRSGAPVGEHLADQLLLPMALAGGGRFRTGPLSLHATTNMEVISKFLDVTFRVEEVEGGVVVSI